MYRVPGPLDLSGLSAIADLNIGELRYPAFVPSTREIPQDTSIFTAIAERAILVQHPYDSFAASVERLIEEAAEDPGVLAIKQTLYRTSGQSPIVDALIDAAEAGKQVVVVVEIKARFDERANIAWARKLEQAGCHVVYGFVGLKTHCKMALIVRQEADGTLRRYCHLGTGNYHPTTARLYEDFGLLTADPAVGEDVTALFNHLTGYTRNGSYRRLLVAPEELRNGIVSRIDRQAERSRAGLPARIVFKSNALVDEVVIDALYRASQSGVRVDLWIRSICALRPGIAGLSETITVRSVVGRFLEHSRDLRLRCRRRRRQPDLDRQRRHDAPEPGPPGGTARPGDRPRPSAAAARPARPRHGRRHVVLVAESGRLLDPAQPGRVRPSAAGHPGDPGPGTSGPFGR